MSKIILFVVFLVVHCTKMFANTTSLSHQPITVTCENPPRAYVNDTVSVIDGAFCFPLHLLKVPGHAPMDLVQNYNSASSYSSWLGQSMTLNYGFWIAFNEFYGKSANSQGKYSHIVVEAPGGSIFYCFAETDTNGKVDYFLDPEVFQKGFTNCGSGVISAKTNFKNLRVKVNIQENFLIDWKAYFPDGTVKRYHTGRGNKGPMNINYETHADGTRYEYTFHKYGRREGTPKRITASGKNILNWLEFDCDLDKKKGYVFSSNGKKAAFSYFEKDDHFFVDRIKTTDMPTVEFHYTNVADAERIDRVQWPEGRFIEVDYDEKGRVIAQKAPVGTDGSKRTLFSFSYHPDDHYTKVTDAFDRKKIYRYKHKRLTAVEHYKGSDLYSSERFFWGEKEKERWGKHPDSDEGNLIAHAFFDKN